MFMLVNKYGIRYFNLWINAAESCGQNSSIVCYMEGLKYWRVWDITHYDHYKGFTH